MDHNARQLLDELERTLKQYGLWADSPPSPAQLSSSTPFAVDTMQFCQWLQFILLPKLGGLLQHGHPLPPMTIAPAAEIYLPQQISAGETQIIRLLARLDALAAQQ